MPVSLSPEIERKIAEAVQAGRFRTPEDLVEIAVRELLASPTTLAEGQFYHLRRKIEESGVPLLSDEDLRDELRERRGRWA
jgi:Arc/MetJ-type ribon-helix-helix transcriptional regulator